MSWEFERVTGPFEFTEGPVWDGEALLFTDIPNDRILRYHPVTGACEEYLSDTKAANGLKFGPDSDLYACQGPPGQQIVRYDETGQEHSIVSEYGGTALNSPNDLAFDSRGRLWFTDPRYGDTSNLPQEHEAVYRADPRGDSEWNLERVTTDTTKPNGILVSPGCEWLYVAQSDPDSAAASELRAYPLDNGQLDDYQVLHNFNPHRGIDGMCLDRDGNIIATAGSDESGPGPMLYVFAPSGRTLETHPYPDTMPTNCTFGEHDLRTLYVTGDGSLYRARTGRQGYLGGPPIEP